MLRSPKAHHEVAVVAAAEDASLTETAKKEKVLISLKALINHPLHQEKDAEDLLTPLKEKAKKAAEEAVT